MRYATRRPRHPPFQRNNKVSKNWLKIYDLAADKNMISKVQEATLETEEYGLVPDVALFGTADWWIAIDSGKIPRHVLTGTISHVFDTERGGWPEFEVESDAGRTRWTALGNERHYREGRRVKIEYVVQKAKKAWIGTACQNEVVCIYVEEE
ncbi:MAG: hypothetical protein ACNA8P_10975 [Phycisphaerales bacterium]